MTDEFTAAQSAGHDTDFGAHENPHDRNKSGARTIILFAHRSSSSTACGLARARLAWGSCVRSRTTGRRIRDGALLEVLDGLARRRERQSPDIGVSTSANQEIGVPGSAFLPL